MNGDMKKDQNVSPNCLAYPQLQMSNRSLVGGCKVFLVAANKNNQDFHIDNVITAMI